MGSVRVLPSKLLRKGDGNYGFFGGAFQVQRFPPHDAHFDDPSIPDVPAFAHTGALHEDETGIPGTGKVIPGKFESGTFGEMVYRDESGGEHLHGIDGLIRSLGVALQQEGIPTDPKSIVQKAIEEYNTAHHDAKNHLPSVDDVKWRKIVVSPYQHGDTMSRGNYGQNGEFITTTTNSHGDNHRYGHFLESYTIPFHNQLESVMKKVGFQNPRLHNFVKYPYISPDKLHYIINPVTGQLQSGAYRIPSGHLKGGVALPDHHLSNFEGLGLPEKAYKDIASWDVVHHLPDTYFLPPLKAKGNSNTTRSAIAHIKRALGHDTSAIGTDVKRVINLNEIGDMKFNNIPLKALLATDDGISQLASGLSKYPAFMALFGDSRPASHVGKLHNLYSQKFGGDDKGYEHFLKHTSHKKDFYRPYENSNRTLGIGNSARKIWAKSLASGYRVTEKETDANSNFRNMDLTDEELIAGGINLDSSPEARANAENVRTLVEYLAHMMSLSHSEFPRRAIPTQEEIDAIPPYVENVLSGGYHEDRALMGIPGHIRHTMPMPISSPVPAGATAGNVAGAPPPITPQGPPSAATIGGPPSPRATTPAPAPAPVPIPQMAGMSPFQQARQQFAQARPADVRATMEQAGIRLPPEPELAQQHMRQFQSAMGDPYQQFLSQYTKSSDTPEEAKSRLVKAIEILQIENAEKDKDIKKHLPQKKMNIDSVQDVRYMANKMNLSPIDVRTIVHSKGDWERITKTYGYSNDIVKVIKVSFGGF